MMMRVRQTGYIGRKLFRRSSFRKFLAIHFIPPVAQLMANILLLVRIRFLKN
jgi:hypothetical protein